MLNRALNIPGFSRCVAENDLHCPMMLQFITHSVFQCIIQLILYIFSTNFCFNLYSYIVYTYELFFIYNIYC